MTHGGKKEMWVGFVFFSFNVTYPVHYLSTKEQANSIPKACLPTTWTCGCLQNIPETKKLDINTFLKRVGEVSGYHYKRQIMRAMQHERHRERSNNTESQLGRDGFINPEPAPVST